MQKYIVAGLGRTGKALLEYLNRQNLEWVGFDEASGATFPYEHLDHCKALLVSPGISLTKPWIEEARKRGIPVVGEPELAARALSGTILAVTGTNGKSTTVTLLNEMLVTGGYSSSLKGNIGSPLITAVHEPPKDFYVVEMSSYQLETIETFHPKISIVMNVTADHLERYVDMNAYAKAKLRIALNQTMGDYFIYNADDPYCLAMLREVHATQVPFTLVNRDLLFGGFVDKQELIIRVSEKESRYSLGECSLTGLHNQENMLASLLAAHLIGVDPKALSHTLKEFKALPHRLQSVGTYKGIHFFDDSKGTNVGSVVMSLASFDQNVILILGGRDKGGDYAPLQSLIQSKVKALILVGEAKDKIGISLGHLKPCYRVETMKDAVCKSYELGKARDVVLLSPACSSFDQYKDYAERGEDFCKWVRHFGG